MPSSSAAAAPPASTASSSSSSRMPPLLEAHVATGPLAREQGSLTLATWVQGASANWLVLRYLYALLGSGGRGPAPSAEDEGEDGGGVPGVVLVSFLRDVRFWADGCMRLGMDLDGLRKSGRFSFVDGLTGLYTTTTTPSQPPSAGDAVLAPSSQLAAIKAQVDAAITRLSTPGRKILVIDGLDAYMAMADADGRAAAAESLLMSLRENVYSTLVTLAADEPLMKAAGTSATTSAASTTTTTSTTSLERAHAALVLGQAHAADQVISLRRLDTGAAADVSGVLRVSTRGDGDGSGGGGGQGEELLYHVAGDGSVRVFERGA